LALSCLIGATLPGAALAGDDDRPASASFTGRGATLADEKGANALNVDLLFQPRFLYLSDGDPDATEATKHAGSGFLMRRALFMANGRIARNLGYRFRANFAKAGSGSYATVLDDAQISYDPREEVKVSVGQFKVPYSSGWQTANDRWAFPELSLAWDGISYGTVSQAGFGKGRTRDIGAMLSGGFAKHLFDYQVGVFSGDGQSVYPPIDNGYLYAARVQISPIGELKMDEIDFSHGKPKVAIGLSANQNRLPNYDAAGDRDGETTDTRLGGELRFAAQGFYATAEYYNASVAATWTDTDPLKAYGYYLLATYDTGWYSVAPGFRYSMLEPNSDENAKDDRLTGVEAVVNYFYPRPGRQKKVRNDDLGHTAQIQAAYGMFKLEGMDHTLYSQFTIALQLGLQNL
jgi:hypothetical protein